jgi:hypothetical protein
MSEARMHSKDVETCVSFASAIAQLHRVSCAVAVGLASLLVACSSGAPLELTSAVPYHSPKKIDQSVAATKPYQTGTRVASMETTRYVASLRTDTRTVAYGRGPYICSPSGFGQTSRCFLR